MPPPPPAPPARAGARPRRPDGAPGGGPRVAWLAGATGLVGSHLLTRLLDAPHVGAVHALVRRLPDVPRTHPRLHYHPVDLDHLPVLPACDDVFIALGTTLAVAGSKAAFRHVDFDLVLTVARAARDAGATRLALVSAMGADAGSPVFYNRVKGEAEAAVRALGFPQLVVAQPSLLLGDREALGQPARQAEGWVARLAGPLSPWLPRAVRPLAADAVAAALVAAMAVDRPGDARLSSAAMQPRRARSASG